MMGVNKERDNELAIFTYYQLTVHKQSSIIGYLDLVQWHNQGSKKKDTSILSFRKMRFWNIIILSTYNACSVCVQK